MKFIQHLNYRYCQKKFPRSHHTTGSIQVLVNADGNDGPVSMGLVWQLQSRPLWPSCILHHLPAFPHQSIGNRYTFGSLLVWPLIEPYEQQGLPTLFGERFATPGLQRPLDYVENL
jgi:hypothetical protein